MVTPIIHHVSAINRDAEKTYEFYHGVLGLNLHLKTVNQDDTAMYHLFFSDTEGRPGTEFTLFEMKSGVDRKFGTNAIDCTAFAVPTTNSLVFWEARLNERGYFNCEIENYNDSHILHFEDPDGVQLALVPVETTEQTYGQPTQAIPLEHAIVGLHSVHLRVRYAKATEAVLTELFNLEVTNRFENRTVLSRPNALFNQEIHLIEDKNAPLEVMGSGGTHHVALSVKDEAELKVIDEKVRERNFLNSGIKDREFFKSTYFREANGILIEVATEEGQLSKRSQAENFADQPLYLPSFLEPRRESIESNLKHN
ncbi:VOC family protein [Jeotgalibaca sp. A122]|uniref:VOC family protein n=1 Tax=Jeotgalibaca sp. A122 TaxID=3457322 RepID=UPI003FD5A4E8